MGAARVRARDLSYGHGKQRALWRVALYLILAFAALIALAALLSPVLAVREDATWALTLQSAASVSALSIASYVMMRWDGATAIRGDRDAVDAAGRRGLPARIGDCRRADDRGGSGADGQWLARVRLGCRCGERLARATPSGGRCCSFSRPRRRSFSSVASRSSRSIARSAAGRQRLGSPLHDRPPSGGRREVKRYE